MTAARLRWVALFACFAAAAAAGAQPPKLRGEAAPAAEPMIGQLMVKLRAPTASERVQALGAQRVSALSASAGVALKSVRAMSGDATVVQLPAPMPLSQAKAVAARLAGDAAVEWVEPDFPVKRQQVTPPDQGYPVLQWNLFPPSQLFVVPAPGGGQRQYTTTGGASLPGAWARTQGSGGIVVAILDTGVAFNHTDLQGRLLAGYDFVSSNALQANGLPPNFVANDGDSRDADATDPGDWVTAAEKTQYAICADGVTGDSPSSWHGTHMAGIVAARWGNDIDPSTGLPRNGTRTAGIAPGVFVLPLRVLGKCGGSSSDVIDAMRWSVGFSVPGVPNNPNRASVVNLSLGGAIGACSTYAQAVSDVLSTGAVIVAAAGNEGTVGVLQPANCAGVIGVAAHAINGDSSVFSNVGPQVAISAPGGGEATQLLTGSPTEASPDDAYYIWSTGLFGPTTPTSFDTSTTPARTGPSLLGVIGTSPATAHVSAAAALLLSINPTLTPAQVATVLRNTARPHPAGGYCVGPIGAGQCGAGLLDVNAAVASVAPPPVSSGGGGGALPLWTLILLAALLLARELRART